MPLEFDFHWLVMSCRQKGISFDRAVEMLRSEWVMSLADEQRKLEERQ